MRGMLWLREIVLSSPNRDENHIDKVFAYVLPNPPHSIQAALFVCAYVLDAYILDELSTDPIFI